jgi:pimeloyl-ACP methyl ester carboxylesterase
MLKHGGLVLGENLSIMDVPLYDKEENYIHTIACGDPRNPPLLLIHGYANSAIFFYLCLKEFAKQFRVYAIDFIGNGSSKRCKFFIYDAKESIDFLVEKIDL